MATNTTHPPLTRNTSTEKPITKAVRWTPVVRVRGCSMQPTLADGQLLLTRPRAWGVNVGDIVVLTTSHGERRMKRRVKRIAAGPGDLVEVEAGRLFVNGRSFDGQPRADGARVEKWLVPHDHFFVVGDNLRQSDDSRVWEEPFVPLARINAVAVRLSRDPPAPSP